MCLLSEVFQGQGEAGETQRDALARISLSTLREMFYKLPQQGQACQGGSPEACSEALKELFRQVGGVHAEEEEGEDLVPLPRGEVWVQDPRPGQDEEARGEAQQGSSDKECILL